MGGLYFEEALAYPRRVKSLHAVCSVHERKTPVLLPTVVPYVWHELGSCGFSQLCVKPHFSHLPSIVPANQVPLWGPSVWWAAPTPVAAVWRCSEWSGLGYIDLLCSTSFIMLFHSPSFNALTSYLKALFILVIAMALAFFVGF